MGNPPYSVGQSSENDANRNLTYERLDQAISDTYVRLSRASNRNSLYDSYVRAIRWGSDRVLASADGGIVAFVTNGGFIDSNSFDGFRKTIASEFHHIYCYNLRGNQRTSGEQSRIEGGKVFGGGSRATVAITLLVKEKGPAPTEGATLSYRDIGDYLTREEKLQLVESQATTEVLDTTSWETISPNAHGDWINQRSDLFRTLQPLIDSSNETSPVFHLRSNGLKTNRDAWIYNSSLNTLKSNTQRMVSFYNNQVDEFATTHRELRGSGAQKATVAKEFVNLDPTKFSWVLADFSRLAQGRRYKVENDQLGTAIYRPFILQHVNFARDHNGARYKLPRIFPSVDAENMGIIIPAKGSPSPFAVVMINRVPDLGIWGISGSHCFPRWVYPEQTSQDSDASLFEDVGAGSRQHNVTDATLASFQNLVTGELSKDDIFFYVYGLLHSPDYQQAFKVDLRKEDCRIPMPANTQAFRGFSEAGRSLATLHTDYESAKPWDELEIHYSDDWNPKAATAYRLVKMRYAKNGKETDRTTVIYNSGITISGIPAEAHDYQLGTRSAIDWIIDRYQIRTHKDSGIVNDPNDWADEHDDPTYIFDLLRRIVTVSMKTNEIVAGLPKLEF